MFMWKLGDKIIREGRSWVGSDGTQYSSAWARMTDAEKESAGLTYVADPKTWDNRFYSGWDSEEKNLIEKKIDDEDATDDKGNKLKDENGNQVVIQGLKSVAIKNAKTLARGKLSHTDWYVTRKSEAGTAIPSSVTTYRTAVRTACKTIEDAITACDTHAKFIALYDAPVDSSGNPTGNPPINDWPDEIS
jgi:hypothetical protein